MTLQRWTRDGLTTFTTSPFETLDQLVLSQALRERLRAITEAFLGAETEYHRLGLPWREGLFFFGPAGSGKSAAARALSLALGWGQLSISSHQILDAHLLERALAEAARERKRVIVLEGVDAMVRTMDPNVFFELLDFAMARADGTFWVACTKHPELSPKTQLIRPGRFDESLRFDAPSLTLRRELLGRLLGTGDAAPDGSVLEALVDQTQNLTFSHFEEMRVLAARNQVQGRTEELRWTLQSYLEDQLIAGDRWGGISDASQELEDRVRAIDPRVLLAALDMSDVFRRLIEKVLGDAADQGRKLEGGSAPEA